jgi:beta-N-acetylhexosaminidase
MEMHRIFNAMLLIVFLSALTCIFLISSGVWQIGPGESLASPQPTGFPAVTQAVSASQLPAETSGPPESHQADPRAEELLSEMSLEEKICQLFIVTPEGLTGVSRATIAGETTKQALASFPVGGIIYYQGNLLSDEQVKSMLSNSQEYSKIPLFLCVDEEGGRVSRAGGNDALSTTHFEAMKVYGAQGDPEAVYNVGRTIGRELRELGFNLNFAPVADVLTNPGNASIGDRSFGPDPELVSLMVKAFVEGQSSSGMISALKHFPGQGGATADTHLGFAAVASTLEELRAVEFLPFLAGIEAGAGIVMVGHITVPEIGGDVPADMSPVIINDILRGELKYDGVVVTDAQNMGAITDKYGAGEAAVLSFAAGADIILMPADLEEAYNGILEAVTDGTLSQSRVDESVLRILGLKIKYGIIP